ncbi:hypothetical protein APHAL10511_006389 [Amanita phalloides]|nr:hypothetical protein APHAL10511_006389 [Amanita phalloides]
MFFTPELLARRDSGFGLLWLAATLGSKSTFKKLPKRSVITADITQLCDLIVQPNEPLALRLSSNLMIGVARIYKVKQELFFSDVNTCVAALKKAAYELQALGEAQLQLAQPTLRSTALTLVPDPKNAFMMEFDMLAADWDEYFELDVPSNKRARTDEDPDYNLISAKRAKIKGRARPAAESGGVNVHTHTLVEHHDHVLSASFDVSNVIRAGDLSLSMDLQEDFGFADFFPISDDQYLGDVLGDELARELGWEAAAVCSKRGGVEAVREVIGLHPDMDTGEVSFPLGPDLNEHYILNEALSSTHQQRSHDPQITNCEFESPCLANALSSPQDYEEQQLPLPFDDITNERETKTFEPRQRPKRTRMLLDTRTELTDDELKIARVKYIQGQTVQRQENDAKLFEKEYNNFLDTKIYGAPSNVAAPALTDFWKANFKMHMDAKACHIIDQRHPKKHRKITGRSKAQLEGANKDDFDNVVPITEDEAIGTSFRAVEKDLYRSSEEPGQGRYASRPPSVIGSNLGLNVEIPESFSQAQKTFLFPWDNAGPSSSTGAVPFALSSNNQVYEERADIQLRGSSRSRRGDSLAPSLLGSNLVPGEFSPAPIDRGSHELVEDYEFEVKSSARNSVVAERRQTEMNMPELERNSLNFLEYAKMQFNTLPNSAQQQLSFDTIVPKPGSTRHVAAAAFYHCLVLGTKNLLHFTQQEPYVDMITKLHQVGQTYIRSMSSRAVLAAKAALATIDLSNYDATQTRLMEERCILVDEDDNAIGAADKKTCHLMKNINQGLLHRAFSAFVFRPSDGRLIIQQRASEKITFPDLWTNTCCSHPLDDFEAEKGLAEQLGVKIAASRKLEHELGIPQNQTPVDQFQYLTRIHYLAPSNGTWGEHEVDYILFLTKDVTVKANANEVRAYKYVSKEELKAMFEDTSINFTPWFKLISRDFLFGWWDELLKNRDGNGNVVAKSLSHLVDDRVIKMA